MKFKILSLAIAHTSPLEILRKRRAQMLEGRLRKHIAGGVSAREQSILFVLICRHRVAFPRSWKFQHLRILTVPPTLARARKLLLCITSSPKMRWDMGATVSSQVRLARKLVRACLPKDFEASTSIEPNHPQ